MPVLRDGTYQYPSGWVNKGPHQGCGHVIYDDPLYYKEDIIGNETDNVRLCTNCRYEMSMNLVKKLGYKEGNGEWPFKRLFDLHGGWEIDAEELSRKSQSELRRVSQLSDKQIKKELTALGC